MRLPVTRHDQPQSTVEATRLRPSDTRVPASAATCLALPTTAAEAGIPARQGPNGALARSSRPGCPALGATARPSRDLPHRSRSAKLP
jgi:hypothetical protein